MKKDKINIQALIEVVILLGFSYLIYQLMESGNILYYVHPKMTKYVLFALIALIMLALFRIKALFTTSHQSGVRLYYLVFILPLILALMLEHQSISSSSADIRGVNLDSFGGGAPSSSSHYTMGKRVVLEPSNYVTLLSEILYSVEKYHGAELELEGFVFKESHLAEGQLIISRTILSCCVADAENIGILSYWQEELKENTWVRAIGTVQSTEYINPNSGRSGVVPMLVIQELEVIPEPDNPYIYP